MQGTLYSTQRGLFEDTSLTFSNDVEGNQSENLVTFCRYFMIRPGRVICSRSLLCSNKKCSAQFDKTKSRHSQVEGRRKEQHESDRGGGPLLLHGSDENSKCPTALPAQDVAVPLKLSALYRHVQTL